MLRYTSSIIESAALLVLAYLLFLIFKPFATPLIFAAVMVVLFDPIHARLNRRIPMLWSSLISTVMILFVIIIPALAIATGIVHETLDLAHTIGTVPLGKLMMNIHTQAARIGIDFDAMVRDAAQRIAGQAGQLATHVIGNTWSVFIGIIVALLSTFFFFRDGKNALAILLRALPLNQEWSKTLIKDIGIMIKSNIAASFVAASIQGLVGGLTFAWFNLPAPVLWGVVMGFFSVLPFFGSWIVWGPAAIGLTITGRVWDAIIIVIIGLALVHPVDNVLRPAIAASATHLNGLLVLIGLLGGIQAFGVSGLLFGPVLVMIGATILTTPWRHVIKFKKEI